MAGGASPRPALPERWGRVARAIVQGASWIVPRDERRHWTRQWLADLHYHVDRLSESGTDRWVAEWDLTRRALGAGRHAAWRRVRGWTHPMIGRDLADAWRKCRATPATSSLIVVTFALGIGANTALFTVVNAVLLRELPYRQPERLVMLGETQLHRSLPTLVSAPNFVDWRARSHSLAQIGAYRPWGFVFASSAAPERLQGARVSAYLFSLVGAAPLAGRTFTSDEDQVGGSHVVLLGEDFWRREFGANTHVVGDVLRLDDTAYEIVGVLPSSFRLPAADVYVPLALARSELDQRGDHELAVVARLSADATLASAQAELNGIALDLARQYPDSNAGRGVSLVPLDEAIVGAVRFTVWLTWAVVGLVMVIAGANAANLLLARAGGRQREMAVRVALGASRARLMRALLVESVLLALAAGSLGLGLAAFGTHAFLALAPATFPRLSDIRIDGAVFAFAVAISLVTGLVFGVMPARRLSRLEVEGVLKDRSATDTDRNGLSRLAVGLQTMLAIVVLVCSGLVVRSLESALAVNLGFDPHHVLVMTINLPSAYADPGRRVGFFDQLLAHINATAGVVRSGLVSHLPLRGSRLSGDFAVVGRPVALGGAHASAEYAVVSEDFFPTLRIALLEGRLFTDRDDRGGAPVAIVNRTFARQFSPDAPPVGLRMVVGATLGASPEPRTVVGVVEDVRATSPELPPQPTIYLPYRQNPWPTMNVLTRTADAVSPVAGLVRSDVSAIDPTLVVTGLASFDDVVARSTAPRRLQAFLLGAFAVMALTLTVLGTYGIATYHVGRRATEFGVRAALGATGRQLVWLAIRPSLETAGLAIPVGLAVAWAAGRGLRAALFGVSSDDPVTYVVVPIVTATMLVLASWLAARRATKIQPNRVLRGA